MTQLQLRRFIATQSMTSSLFTTTHTIKQTVNFPSYLINEINPSLKHKYKIKKQRTKFQQSLHADSFINTRKKSLIIESEDESIVNQISDIVRYIEYHTTFFHLSTTRSISPTLRPSVALFKHTKTQNSEINAIARKHDCYVWHLYEANKFGIFSDNQYKLWSCVQYIRHYIENNKQHMDYAYCDEIYKSLYFRKSNKSFLNLMTQCDDRFGVNSYLIENRFCDKGYVWI
eukprot:105278_1